MVNLLKIILDRCRAMTSGTRFVFIKVLRNWVIWLAYLCWYCWFFNKIMLCRLSQYRLNSPQFSTLSMVFFVKLAFLFLDTADNFSNCNELAKLSLRTYNLWPSWIPRNTSNRSICENIQLLFISLILLIYSLSATRDLSSKRGGAEGFSPHHTKVLRLIFVNTILCLPFWHLIRKITYNIFC